jgi:hypothetical protein
MPVARRMALDSAHVPALGGRHSTRQIPSLLQVRPAREVSRATWGVPAASRRMTCPNALAQRSARRGAECLAQATAACVCCAHGCKMRARIIEFLLTIDKTNARFSQLAMTAVALWQACTSVTKGVHSDSSRVRSDIRDVATSRRPAMQDEPLDDGVTQGVLGVSTGVTKHLF